MKHVKFIPFVLLVMGVLATVVISCTKDDPPAELSLVSLTSGSVDLNGITSPNNVPVGETITATFSTEVDPASANANISLLRDYDNQTIASAITVNGKTITIKPNADLITGALHKLSFAAGLKSTKGKTLSPADRTFTTDGFFAPAGQIAYWNFENNANDIVGTYDPAASDVVAITYVDGRKPSAGKAANFDGDASIIEVPNGDILITRPDFSMSFWVKTNSAGHNDGATPTPNPTGHFVIGLGAFFGLQFEIPADYKWCKFAVQYAMGDGTTDTKGDLFFNGDGKTKDNGGWQGTEVRKDLTTNGGVDGLIKDKWAHIVFTYESSTRRRSMYINGELAQRENFNLWPAGDKATTATGIKFNPNPDVGKKMAFGFIKDRSSALWATEPWGGYTFPGANHFKGQLDDIRAFSKALTQAEITLMYNSEK
ncbi:MAG: Ig-like domain-containing protein [Chryseotalea sp. WA131a]|nr:MAG: Ig-like domain-containing protein [Chryseotalea sp. WA131a]